MNNTIADIKKPSIPAILGPVIKKKIEANTNAVKPAILIFQRELSNLSISAPPFLTQIVVISKITSSESLRWTSLGQVLFKKDNNCL